eukprot:3454145-Rhodomonas_salina.4
MSSSDRVSAARSPRTGEPPSTKVCVAIRLHTLYALPGTDIAYGATSDFVPGHARGALASLHRRSLGQRRYPPRAVLRAVRYSATVIHPHTGEEQFAGSILRIRYAMSGTDIGCAAARHVHDQRQVRP